MSQKVFKFDSADLIKFIKIYRGHDCLWDIKNKYYKNRDARNAALIEFAQEFGVEGVGPKEITNKIKNLRTQYLGERKKVKGSMGTGSITDVYKPKLPWYMLMDSFLRKTSRCRGKTSNTSDISFTAQEMTIEYRDNIKTENLTNSTVQILNDVSPSPVPKKSTKKLSDYIQPALHKLENISKRRKLENNDDDLDNFGKYVASSLRILNIENCIHAQDEIQGILSKYKLREFKEKAKPESPYSEQDSEVASLDL